MLPIRVKDISTGFKLYATEKLRGLSLTSRNLDINQEIIGKFLIANPAPRWRMRRSGNAQ